VGDCKEETLSSQPQPPIPTFKKKFKYFIVPIIRFSKNGRCEQITSLPPYSQNIWKGKSQGVKNMIDTHFHP
jgi:hypothetical protein